MIKKLNFTSISIITKTYWIWIANKILYRKTINVIHFIQESTSVILKNYFLYRTQKRLTMYKNIEKMDYLKNK